MYVRSDFLPCVHCRVVNISYTIIFNIHEHKATLRSQYMVIKCMIISIHFYERAENNYKLAIE